MSNMKQRFNAGQTQATVQEWSEGTNDKANAAADRMSPRAQSDSCQLHRDETTGGQMMHMAQDAMSTMRGAAQGAADTVKHRLGHHNSKSN